ncbi:excisionase family DNA-binding protein [Kineosporia sp. A_224]|uniref:excisionase family DNA-binding protein n=1 Tax=Kineosporia sp. A_224 TaxID=1962180 RepID=UPI0018EA05CF|nr:excisionase family DNA-binding protein [Kineosporia sp. A_224]
MSGSRGHGAGPVQYVRVVDIRPRWLTTAEVAVMLGYGLTKTKMLVVTGELRSLKDGGSRRIMPEWVDEYVARRVAEAEGNAA